MPVRFTPLMKPRLTRRAREMIERSLPHFPELQGKTITVGYTRKHLGSATVIYRRGSISALVIRLKVRKLNYQTIGHELIHLVQAWRTGTVRSLGSSTDNPFHPAKSNATFGLSPGILYFAMIHPPTSACRASFASAGRIMRSPCEHFASRPLHNGGHNVVTFSGLKQRSKDCR